MNKEEIIKYCLTLENTYKDCPFPDDFESVTMKHLKNKKWFALIMNANNKLYLNVKTDPNYSDILRNTYDYIIPAYHMNKEHWNTIIVDEKYRRKGYGKILLEKAIKELGKPVYTISKVDEFYLKNGFVYDNADLIDKECKTCEEYTELSFPIFIIL